NSRLALMLGVCARSSVEFPRGNDAVVMTVAERAPRRMIGVGAREHLDGAAIGGQIRLMRFEIGCSRPFPLVDEIIPEAFAGVLKFPREHIRLRDVTRNRVRVSVRRPVAEERL